MMKSSGFPPCYRRLPASDMESYEEFALRSRALLREEGRSGGQEKDWKSLCSLKDLSTILFYGRAVLPPLLTAEQRRDMCDYRERALQAPANRQNQRKTSVLSQVQNILDLAVQQVHDNKEPGGRQEDWLPHPKCPSSPPKQETVHGYTLVTDSPGLLRDSGCALEESSLPATPCSEPRQPSVPKIDWLQVELENQEKIEDDGEEEDKDEEEEDISLDSLLKRSREYVEKQNRWESAAIARTPPPPHTPPPLPAESLGSDKESGTRASARDSGVEFGFSLRHSPVGPARGPVLVPHTAPLADPYAAPQRLPSPEAARAHTTATHRRKPRPVSAGNLQMSFPMGQGDLILRSPVGGSPSEACWSARRSSDHCGPVGRSRASRCGDDGGEGPAPEMCSPPGRSAALSPLGHHELQASGFRRRCHTLDSQLYPGAEPGVDRSQERLPRFMAGVTRLPPHRRTSVAAGAAAAPLNQSYDVERPSAGLLRPHMSPDGGPQGQARGLES
ncbi:hypothetical protein CRUP_036670, partial [Coryphaenoides rupestris]